MHPVDCSGRSLHEASYMWPQHPMGGPQGELPVVSAPYVAMPFSAPPYSHYPYAGPPLHSNHTYMGYMGAGVGACPTWTVIQSQPFVGLVPQAFNYPAAVVNQPQGISPSIHPTNSSSSSSSAYHSPWLGSQQQQRRNTGAYAHKLAAGPACRVVDDGRQVHANSSSSNTSSTRSSSGSSSRGAPRYMGVKYGMGGRGKSIPAAGAGEHRGPWALAGAGSILASDATFRDAFGLWRAGTYGVLHTSSSCRCQLELWEQ